MSLTIRLVTVSLIGLCSMTLGAPAHADLLFSHPGDADGLGSSRPSNINPGGTPFNLSIAAENFVLANDSSVELVRYWGVNSTNFSDPLAFVNSFRVRFFEDDGTGLPGALVSDQTISKNSVTVAAGTTIYFSHELTLPAPVDLAAGTTYWLSIAANKQFNDTQNYWSWQQSSMVDGTQIALQFNPTGAWSTPGGSEVSTCFELEGTADTCGCIGNLDDDCDTDVLDFTELAAAFGSVLGEPNFNPDADYDDDDAITVLDFGIWSGDFGCAN